MSLSIGLPAAFVSVSKASGIGTASAPDEAEPEAQARSPLAAPDAAASDSTSSAGFNADMGEVVNTLLDRLAELQQQLQEVRRELRAAINSLQPPEVRMPRILSLQRQLVVINGNIQLVSGLLVAELSKSTVSVSATV